MNSANTNRKKPNEQWVTYTEAELCAKIKRGEDQTDWEKVDRQGDKIIDEDDFTGEPPPLSEGQFYIAGQPVSQEEGQAAFRKALAKKQVNLWLDQAIIDHFKAKAGGRGYQTLINEALRSLIEREALEATLRRVIREELERAAR